MDNEKQSHRNNRLSQLETHKRHLSRLAKHHLDGILGFVTAHQLKDVILPEEADLVTMGDFRFKGYPNAFMQSPRVPIVSTKSSLVHATASHIDETKQEDKENLSEDMLMQARDYRSAELNRLQVQKAEAEGEIARLKQEKLRMILNGNESRRSEMNGYKADDPSPAEELSSKGIDKDNVFANEVKRSPTALDLATPQHPDFSKTIQELADLYEKRTKEAENSEEFITAKAKQPSTPFEFYDPWGKGIGNPRRQADGNTQRYPQIKQQGIVPDPSSLSPQTKPLQYHESETGLGTGLNMESPYGGGGEAVKTGSGNRRTRFPITMRRDIHGNSSLKELDTYNPFKHSQSAADENYFPYGKPGAGAPRHDSNGKLISQRHNIDFTGEIDTSADVHKRRRAADEYLQELKREMIEQQRAREEASVDLRAPIGELASVVRQGKVGFPKRDPNTGSLLNHHHKNSDITKHALGEDDLSASLNKSRLYHDELTRLAGERHRARMIDKLRDTQEDIQHSQNWNSYWGKPGGGAPNTKLLEFRRSNVDYAIHHPENTVNEYVKNTPHGILKLSPRNYHKTTIPSNHQNMFELPQDRTQRPVRVDYEVVAPFATMKN